MIIQDVTTDYNVEKLINENDYKDKVLATVTHDLKTPINGIISQI